MLIHKGMVNRLTMCVQAGVAVLLQPLFGPPSEFGLVMPVEAPDDRGNFHAKYVGGPKQGRVLCFNVNHVKWVSPTWGHDGRPPRNHKNLEWSDGIEC